MAKQIKYLFILDEATRFILEDDKDNLKIILDEESFNAFISSDFNIKKVIILVELEWNGHTLQEFYGYEVAKKLMISTAPGNAFDIQFISTFDRDTVFNLYKSSNRIFIQKYPHVNLSDFNPEKINIPDISQRKFNYLKNYCLLKSGIVDRFEHELRKFINNPDSSMLLSFITDMQLNKDVLSESILNKASQLQIATDNAERKRLLLEIHSEFLELSDKLNRPSYEKRKKSHSKVILIEDDKNTLGKLLNHFQNYFYSVTPFESGSLAYKELENDAMKYDVVITDMELLQDTFDDPIQGIDILELCEKDYPFLVTRIITALPKNALKQLTGKGFDEIIFKDIVNEDVIPPFEKLVEFVNRIDQEVKRKQRLRNLRGPKNSWWGTYLTRKLHLTEIDEPEKFSIIWENAFSKAAEFINGKFNSASNEEKLVVEFKSPKNASENPESGWEIIELLLTHRLIVLWYFVVKVKEKTFYWKGDDGTEYTSLLGFQSGIENRTAKAYLNTFLGFSGKKLPDS
ncbi:MAG: hypothetical protein ACOZBL_01035, partial [Patescibacteria group bacterium]